MFVPPGSTQPVKYGDFIKNYIPHTEHQSRMNNGVRAALEAVAKLRSGQKPAQQQQTRTQQQPQGDAFASVRGLPIIDGATLATLGERIQKEGLAPLYEWAGVLNQYLTKLDGRVKGAEQGVGAYAEAQTRQEFEGKLGGVLNAVAKEVLPGIDVSKHPVLRDFAEDVYLSYNPNDPNLEREYPGILKARLEGFMQLAQALGQAKVQAARAQARSFLTRGGSGQPANAGGAPRLSNRQIARNMFASDASRT